MERIVKLFSIWLVPASWNVRHFMRAYPSLQDIVVKFRFLQGFLNHFDFLLQQNQNRSTFERNDSVERFFNNFLRYHKNALEKNRDKNALTYFQVLPNVEFGKGLKKGVILISPYKVLAICPKTWNENAMYGYIHCTTLGKMCFSLTKLRPCGSPLQTCNFNYCPNDIPRPTSPLLEHRCRFVDFVSKDVVIPVEPEEVPWIPQVCLTIDEENYSKSYEAFCIRSYFFLF